MVLGIDISPSLPDSMPDIIEAGDEALEELRRKFNASKDQFDKLLEDLDNLSEDGEFQPYTDTPSITGNPFCVALKANDNPEVDAIVYNLADPPGDFDIIGVGAPGLLNVRIGANGRKATFGYTGNGLETQDGWTVFTKFLDDAIGFGTNSYIGVGDNIDIVTLNNRSGIVDTGEGDDIIYGGSSIDTINGGEGNDIISSGGGRDILTGGEGADTFVIGLDTYIRWTETSIYASGDTITLPDFEHGVDVIDFSEFSDYWPEHYLDLTITHFDGYTEITIGPYPNEEKTTVIVEDGGLNAAPEDRVSYSDLLL